MFSMDAQRQSAAFSRSAGIKRRRVHVYDCRYENNNNNNICVETSGLDFNAFLQILHKKFAIPSHEVFVVATTDRTVLDFDQFKELQDGSTLYILQREDQALPRAMKEQIMFRPHFDTLIKCGMYEYYSSEGRNSLSYALAELIDNALSATAKNTEIRTIELRMLFDESLGKPAVVILDNGCGMMSKQLNNWAVFRLSKFTRENSTFASKQKGYVRPDPVPRSLNSDISYFGVGGKQAVFFIGNSTRMISKPVGSPDVHELVLSEEDFQRKENNKEDVYSGTITNRKPGDSSHVNGNERFLHELIAEEYGKESFTAVVITGVKPEHITFFKENFTEWTRELAHIYHYYIHGVNGNDGSHNHTNADQSPKIEIQITMRERPPKLSCVLNLREVDDDMQTQYINATEDTFEFKATTGPDSGKVEGVIRYHPFLYDRETYPPDPYALQAPPNDEDDNECGALQQARGKRPIFECFWNGRLIPYTRVDDFDWCTWPIKGAKVPEECYSRFSGVLFTDDRFRVTTNKLTFMDLEVKIKSKDTIFTRVVNGQVQRRNIHKEFTEWLKNCHEKLDKQVKFIGFKKTITRTDVATKKMQHPWATFSSIEWDGKIYKAGQLVKSQKTQRIHHGTVVRFLLYGYYEKDVFATGGQVEVALEPKELYGITKIMPISKIDRTVTDEAIKKNIDNDLAKLPDRLNVAWPDSNPWPENAVRRAGTPLGPLKIDILNKKEESISRMPSTGQSTVTKLCIKMTIGHDDPETNEEDISFVAQHSAKWGFWFRKHEKLTKPGKYTLSLTTMINETHDTKFGGRELPSYILNFTIKAGNAKSFVLGTDNSTLRVGAPFDITLQLKDQYGNLTMDLPTVQPVLQCSDLGLSYAGVDNSGTKYIIRGVKARGKVLNYQQSKRYDLKVTLPGLKKDTETIKISLLPGHPHSLHVKEEDNPIIVENGNPVKFNVEIHDEAGNITAYLKQTLQVHCKIKGLPPAVIDCSTTGAGQLLTGPINLKIIGGEPQNLKVQFEVPNHKSIASVVRELQVMPSSRVSLIKLFSQDDESLVLKNNDKIEWPAGGSLECLFFKLYDEAGKVIPLTAEIASMIKVNWKDEQKLQDLVQGKLPDIKVPTQLHEKRFYQVSYKDQNVSVSFTIIPRPLEPDQLKATLHQNTVKLGEILSGTIYLELVDEYDNATNMLISTSVNQITVKAEGLDKSDIAFNWQEKNGSIEVTGIRFQGGTPGWRDMCFTYLRYVAHVKVQVTAGNPANLKLVSMPEQPLQVLNGHSIPTPFLVQLSDKWGNPSSDQRVVVELRPSPSTLKVMTAVTSQPVDTEGNASFEVTSVSGPPGGGYQLQFKGSLNNTPIPGPSVNLTVIPDPNKPVSLSVEYDSTAVFPAGGSFPVFSVIVVSDDGSPMTIFNPAAASMWLWEGVSSGETPPQTATEMKCSKPMANERKDCFHFRDKEIPQRAGKHIIQFSLHINETNVLFSDQISVNVVANQPIKLAPDSPPAAPVVSCCANIANRILVQNMTLRIMDSYGNPAGQNLSGKVVVSITSSTNTNLPLFEGKSNRYYINLEEGKAHITRLAIMENSPGEDGSAYTLRFEPEVSMVQFPLAYFELHFHYYNDAANQQQMTALLKKKTELTAFVTTQKKVIADYNQLFTMLSERCLTARGKEAECRNILVKNNMDIAQLTSITDTDRLLKEMSAECERIMNMPRRVCSIRDNFKGQQDVLGVFGHLAYVEDDAAARVISWAARGAMDCVITKTLEAAQKIYRDTDGMQLVMPLDNVFVSQCNRTLPHIRNGQILFDPPGNPVFAIDLLIYSCLQESASCDKAFKNILGDTIVMDDLRSANKYRQEVVLRRMPCPTILTKEGDRVCAKGMFGGKQNKAPPIDRLQVFGAPLPKHFYTVKKQIELVTEYQTAMKKREMAEKERDDHERAMNSPHMLKTQKDMEEKMKQLEETERLLTSKSPRPVKRRPVDAGEASDIITKRAK